MILTLHLAAESGSPAEVRTLEQGTLTIGRGTENGWVLTDPDRTISKQHCRIDCSEDGFLLTDTSTNGVFVGSDIHPVGRGHSRVLADGDTIVVGPHHLTASIAQPPAALPFEAEELAPLPAAAPLPYSGTAQAPGSPMPASIEAPWLDGIPGGKFGPGLRAAPQGWDAPPDPADFSATGLRHEANLLDGAAVDFSHDTEHSAATATVMRLPAAQTVLPNNWNDVDPLEGAELTVLPAEAALAKAASVEAPLPLHEPREAWSEAPAATQSNGVAREPAAARLVAAFLAGSGLPQDALAGPDLEVTFRALGALLRISVDGVREILATRKIVKSELRADQTEIQASNNNPMKFAPDVQRCLEAMVGQPPVGFIPGPEAMQGSMNDIKLHELALVGALNSVFTEMTAQLDPEAITTHVRNEAGLNAILPYAREARCWAVYIERYRALQESGAENTAGSLLAPVAAAYARHVRRGG